MFSGNTSQVSDGKLYVEDVFSTWLYTGNLSTQTITNGIDLAGKGGMIWLKNRTQAAAHFLFDTSRGPFSLTTNNTLAAGDYTGYQSFTSSGFSIGATGSYNLTGNNYASWTFREAPKFFDVVTWTGTGVVRDIPHSLGVAPGMIIIKKTNAAQDWTVYHRSTGPNYNLVLNSTAAAALNSGIFPRVTSTSFGIDYVNDYNAVGSTYVAYLFAHDATSDGFIQCGSYTYDSNGDATINLGWEPQFLITKLATGNGTVTTSNWALFDTMRGFNVTSAQLLNPNLSNAETTSSVYSINSTGFSVNSASSLAGVTDIYIAIRRGPMKTPTLGTSVYTPLKVTSSTTGSVRSFGFAADAIIGGRYDSNETASNWFWIDRLRGFTASTDDATGNAQQKKLLSSTTAAETTNTSPTNPYLYNIWNSSALQGTGAGSIGNGGNLVYYALRRAPGFFDEVCYTGTFTANRNINHTLGVVPELIIMKDRTIAYDWRVYYAFTGTGHSFAFLNQSAAGSVATYTALQENAPTATTFSLGRNSEVNGVGDNYVAYLFASCPGVSKVGSYTGNGSSQTINCGFAAGARFVLIKRTNSSGDWYVWDTARGIVAGNDPHLSLNTTAAEVTTDDTIDTDSSGFVVNQVAATNVNVSSATYIYLAIA